MTQQLGTNKTRFKTEIWVKPGEHQTLEELLLRFEGSILQVDNDNGEILIAVTEDVQEVS